MKNNIIYELLLQMSTKKSTNNFNTHNKVTSNL